MGLGHFARIERDTDSLWWGLLLATQYVLKLVLQKGIVRKQLSQTDLKKEKEKKIEIEHLKFEAKEHFCFHMCISLNVLSNIFFDNSCKLFNSSSLF